MDHEEYVLVRSLAKARSRLSKAERILSRAHRRKRERTLRFGSSDMARVKAAVEAAEIEYRRAKDALDEYRKARHGQV